MPRSVRMVCEMLVILYGGIHVIFDKLCTSSLTVVSELCVRFTMFAIK